MQKEKYPLAYMQATIEDVLAEAKDVYGGVSYRSIQETVGLSTNTMVLLKKGLM